MKKVGVFTIQDNNNYGNRLQNFALQEAIKQLGFDCFTFKNYRRTNFKGKKIKIKILGVLVKFKEGLRNAREKSRSDNFREFNRSIRYYNREIDYSDYIEEFSKFEYIVVGSDQVWNRNILRLSSIDLLEGLPKNKRIAYAASFGTSIVPKECLSELAKNIPLFKKISVREFAGKKIIKDATGRDDVNVVVDPTMLIDPSKWAKMAKRPKNMSNEKYILTYFLGLMSKDRQDEIQRFARNKGWKVIDVLDKKGGFYDSGPAEFLWLEMNAELVCTDSFHSSVFAFLFNRPFLIFPREDQLEDMSSRLDTLVEEFELHDRRFAGSITDENLIYDYGKSYKILKDKKEKSIEFLQESLGNSR